MKIERRSFIKLAALLPTLTLGGPSTDDAACTDDGTLLYIGLKKQLFFDDLLIASVQNIMRELHHPERAPENPLIIKDKPWEHVVLVRTSSYRVLRDPKDRLFKAWWSDEGWTQKLVESSVTWPPYRDEYAFSEDGIHWTKPGLGIYRWNGQDTNIFRGDGRTWSAEVFDVILDPFESDESRRFKSIYLWAPINARGQGNYEQGHYVIQYSGDGIHWKNYNQLPTFGKVGNHLDDVILLNYNLYSRLYLLNTRHPDMEKAALNPRFPRTKSFFRPSYPDDFAKINKRRIYQCESSDLIHWNEPRLILAPDDEDNLDDYFYGMAQYRVSDSDTWVGFLDVLHSVPDFIDVHLTYSLDGRCWNRIREPWFTRGPAGSWDQVMVEISIPPLEMGDELWFYYGGNGYGHHDWYSEWYREGLNPPNGKNISKVGFFLGLAKLRLDGFCSLNAGPVREGILITRQLASPGKGVVINAQCGQGGYIDVEVFNQADEVLPGYSRKEFDRFTGDSVRHQLSWQSRTKVPPEDFRRLIFYMFNAKLYSLHFSA